MSAVLKIVDERFGPGGREKSAPVELGLASERVTPREIIRRRVEAEVEVVNGKKLAQAAASMRTRSFLIAVEPATEGVLNIPRARRKPALAQVEEETARAIAAFGRQGFIMLLDDRQIEDLDAEVTLTPASEVVFLYLTPLKGG